MRVEAVFPPLCLFSAFCGHLDGRVERLRGEVVAGLRIVALLARVILVACARKRYCYQGWDVFQDRMRALFLVLLLLIARVYRGRLVNGFRTLHLAAGGDEDDDIRTVSYDTYVPFANY